MNYFRGFLIAFAVFMLLASVSPVEVLSGDWFVRTVGVLALLIALDMRGKKDKESS